MPFDLARDLPRILGTVAQLRGGSNAFSQRWAELEAQEAAQQQRAGQLGLQERQFGLQERQQQSLEDRSQQELMLRAENQRQQAEQERRDYTAQVQNMFLNPEVDPDVALRFATDPNALPSGYDVGAVEALHRKVFTPTEKQRRLAVRKLKEIESAPEIKRRLESGETLDNVTFTVSELGPNPASGQPLWTRAELQQLAKRPVATGALPKLPAQQATPGSFEEYVDLPPEEQAIRRQQRREFQEAGRRPPPATAPPPIRPGRNILSSDVNRLAELDTSLDDVDVLEQEIGITGAGSQFGAMIPNVISEFTGVGLDAKSRQATIDRVKQVIGKALEDGVLRKEDEAKYVKILPTIGDPPAVAATKIRGLRAAITQRRERMLEALTNAGFDTSRFLERTTRPAPPSTEQPHQPISAASGPGDIVTLPDGRTVRITEKLRTGFKFVEVGQ